MKHLNQGAIRNKSSLHAGVPATRNERRSEPRGEWGEGEKELSLPLPVLLAARFASLL